MRYRFYPPVPQRSTGRSRSSRSANSPAGSRSRSSACRCCCTAGDWAGCWAVRSSPSTTGDGRPAASVPSSRWCWRMTRKHMRPSSVARGARSPTGFGTSEFIPQCASRSDASRLHPNSVSSPRTRASTSWSSSGGDTRDGCASSRRSSVGAISALTPRRASSSATGRSSRFAELTEESRSMPGDALTHSPGSCGLRSPAVGSAACVFFR